MSEPVIPSQWTRLDVEEMQGTVVIVGASDTGKSTLARYLFRQLCRAGQVAAYLDLDVGQSTLGLPTTLNVALAAEPGDDDFPPQGAQATFFVGATTPRGHMLPLVVGAHRLQQRALAEGAEGVVVDTTGLVDRAQGGQALKQWLIEQLAPALVIGLQRDRELEPILWPLRRDGRLRCVELPVSDHVRERSREARIARRRERFALYFEQARSREVDLRQVAVYDLAQMRKGALLAFQNEEAFTLDLGAVQEADRRHGNAVIHTPLSSPERVASVRFGQLRWDVENQRELRGS